MKRRYINSFRISFHKLRTSPLLCLSPKCLVSRIGPTQILQNARLLLQHLTVTVTDSDRLFADDIVVSLRINDSYLCAMLNNVERRAVSLQQVSLLLYLRHR